MEVFIVLLVLGLISYMIMKEYNATVMLLAGGMILLFSAAILGHPIFDVSESSGLTWLDPFKSIQVQLIKQLNPIGLTIMVLFGFSSYTTAIKANEVAVRIMTAPIAGMKSKYMLVPVVFLLGNVLSLVVPSASSLAVLLMATLYPALQRSGMSSLTAGAIIATAATIMPTPLGADNVVAAQNLGVGLIEYVFGYHAKISIPALIVMAIAHYFWQKYMDKRQQAASTADIDTSKLILSKDLPPAYYGILPILPLVLVIVFGLIFSKVKFDIIGITFICFILTILVDLFHKRNVRMVFDQVKFFFKGMGDGFASVVTLLVAASLLVQGIQAMGILDMLLKSVRYVSGASLILMLIFCAITTIIALISGSGLAAFYSFIVLIPAIAEQSGVNAIAIALPMQLFSNLVRSISPVSAVVIIVASIIKVSPMEVVKRTSIPIILSMLVCMVLSIAMFGI